MKRYGAVVKIGILNGLVYRGHIFFTLITNMFYIVVIYFLWKSIYHHSDTLNGMTFNQVFVYLALTGSIFVLFTTYVAWRMSHEIVQGQIIMDLSKPLDYQLLIFARSIGPLLIQFALNTAPSLIMIVLVFGGEIVTGINLLFFPISLLCAYLISFLLDYMVGLTAFYTESIWGINITKDLIVLFLSGALIPIRFFPEGIRQILYYLPFQAIYNAPVSMLVDPEMGLSDYLSMLGIQLIWVAAIWLTSRLFFGRAIRAVTVNGG